MPSSSRLRTLEAIRMSAMHQSMATASSGVAMMRFRAATVSDPAKALDLVRSLVQNEITEKISVLLQEYVEEFFNPAIDNAKRNLRLIHGDRRPDINTESLLDDVCMNALEHAKSKYKSASTRANDQQQQQQSAPLSVRDVRLTQSGTVVQLPSNPSLTIEPTVLSVNRGVKRKSNGYLGATTPDDKVTNHGGVSAALIQKSSAPSVPTTKSFQNPLTLSMLPPPPPPAIQRSNSSDLILITKHGKPVRREGSSWDPSRLTSETLFVLGSKANKALGLGQTRGRLYMKHPELFKYSGDAEDKEWLTKNQVMSTTGGKAYLMVLQDIICLSQTDEYSSSCKLQLDELAGGFHVPAFIIQKMRAFMASVRTDPSVSDEVLLAEAKVQLIKTSVESGGPVPSSRKASSSKASPSVVVKPRIVPSTESGSGKIHDVHASGSSETGNKTFAAMASRSGVGVDGDSGQGNFDRAEEGQEDYVVEKKSDVNNVVVGEGDEDDEVDLGSFLHGVNLSSLVKEFEKTEDVDVILESLTSANAADHEAEDLQQPGPSQSKRRQSFAEEDVDLDMQSANQTLAKAEKS